MIIPEFKLLRNIIVNSCSTFDDVTEIDKKYKFKIDFVKMENMLKQKKVKLHILAFDKVQESYEPGLKEIQMIAEYIKSESDFERIFNGKTTICNFMLFYTENKDGSVDIHDNNDNIMTDKQLFDACNGKPNEQLILDIMKELPVFRVIIERSFDFNDDRFKYRVYFRQNNEMTEYYENLKENNTNDVE